MVIFSKNTKQYKIYVGDGIYEVRKLRRVMHCLWVAI